MHACMHARTLTHTLPVALCIMHVYTVRMVRWPPPGVFLREHILVREHILED